MVGAGNVLSGHILGVGEYLLVDEVLHEGTLSTSRLPCHKDGLLG
jgi:hypothetical protein